MLEQGQKVKTIGVFTVAEVQEEFVELDPFEKGTENKMNSYNEKGTIELTKEGAEKEFDGFQKGDFFVLNGEYSVVRLNDFFAKIMVDDQMVSLPISKLAPL